MFLGHLLQDLIPRSELYSFISFIRHDEMNKFEEEANRGRAKNGEESFWFSGHVTGCCSQLVRDQGLLILYSFFRSEKT